MKKRNIISILIIALIFIGCNEGHVYRKNKKGFPDYRWAKEKSLEYNPVIENIDAEYNIYFEFRHIHGFQFQNVKIKIEITSPANVVTTQEYIIPVFGKDGEELSECAVDYCDLVTLIEGNYKFTETGEYKFVISYDMEQEYLPNVMEVGLTIDKIE